MNTPIKTSATIKTAIKGFVEKIQSEARSGERPEHLVAYSQAILNMSLAYQHTREVELHEEFHVLATQEDDIEDFYKAPGTLDDISN